jgi:hypothetical protein
MSERIKTLIQARLDREGYAAKEWREGEDGLEAVIGRFVIVEDDEDRGLYSGDEGPLTACIVGSPEYHNERILFAITPEGQSGALEVRLDQVDWADE